MIRNLTILSSVVVILSVYTDGLDAATNSHYRTQNGVVVKGGTFHLKCASANRVCGALQWIKRGLWGAEEAISYGRSLIYNFGGRYNLNDSGVPCDVRIEGVQIADAGEFACVSPDNGRQSAVLTVLELAPQCWHNANNSEVLEGESVSVHCSLEGYHTPGEARLEWLDAHNQAVVSAATAQRPRSINSTFIVVAKSPAVYPFTCRTSFELYEQKLGAASNVPDISCSTSLIRVVYPVRDIRLRMNGTRLTTGKKVTCSADGAPEPSYHWISLTTGDVQHGNTITLQPGQVYQCIASNVVQGKTYEEKSWEIYVRQDIKNSGITKSIPGAPIYSTIHHSPSSSSSSSSSSPSSSNRSPTDPHNHQADEANDVERYNYEDNKIDEVTLRSDVTYADRPVAIFSNERNVSISTVVLGVILLISLVIILILVVHLCGLRDKLKEAGISNDKREQVTSLAPNKATIDSSREPVTSARQAVTQKEKNDSTKSLLSETSESKREGLMQAPKPQMLGNGRSQDGV